MGTGKKRIVIFEDHSLMRDGMCSWFVNNTDWEVIYDAGTIEEVQDLIEKLSSESTLENPIIALVDISFKCADGEVGVEAKEKHYYGFEIVRTLAEKSPYTRCIMYSSYTSGTLIDKALSREVGAKGYVSKNADEEELLRAVESVASGKNYVEFSLMSRMLEAMGLMAILTKREKQIVEKMVLGLSPLEIAKDLGMSKRTLENHFSHLYDKTGTISREELLNRLGL